jgi:hypothetical protein
MAAPLKLASLRIKHEDGWVVRLVLVAFVDHVEVARAIDRDIVRCLPAESFGQLRPLMDGFVTIVSLANDDR